MKKKITILLVCLMLFTVLAGCKSEPGEGILGSDTVADPTESSGAPSGLLLAENGKTDYCIVYPLNAGSEIMNAVNELMNAFKTSYNVRIACKSDAGAAGSSGDENALEILVGNTNRPATAQVLAQLKENEYTACAVGNQVVLLGDTDRATARAVENFLSAHFSASGSSLLFAEDSEFRMTLERRLRISIFGDSISTYDGYSNSTAYNSILADQPIYYRATHMSVGETWWQRVITGMNGELCVNNSYSGGRVTHDHTPKRAANLHNNAGDKPDVILIYYGINDFHNMVGKYIFSEAYDQMLKIMKEAYPEAKIYCCTLNAIQNGNTGTTLEQNGAGVSYEAYNNLIKEVAAANGVEVIDLYSRIGTEIYKYTFDHIHPNSEGMKMMSEAILADLREDFQQAA